MSLRPRATKPAPKPVAERSIGALLFSNITSNRKFDDKPVASIGNPAPDDIVALIYNGPAGLNPNDPGHNVKHGNVLTWLYQVYSFFSTAPGPRAAEAASWLLLWMENVRNYPNHTWVEGWWAISIYKEAQKMLELYNSGFVAPPSPANRNARRRRAGRAPDWAADPEPYDEEQRFQDPADEDPDAVERADYGKEQPEGYTTQYMRDRRRGAYYKKDQY